MKMYKIKGCSDLMRSRFHYDFLVLYHSSTDTHISAYAKKECTSCAERLGIFIYPETVIPIRKEERKVMLAQIAKNEATIIDLINRNYRCCEIMIPGLFTHSQIWGHDHI